MITTCPHCGYTLQSEHTALVFECPKCQADYASYRYLQKRLEQKQFCFFRKLKRKFDEFSLPDNEFLIYVILIVIYLFTLFLRFSAEAI
ncbi:hypothetical protein [Entomomonas asaccharolytica]|uniref:Uncharacterized protein n=1 Tax=Entomomonas asaccharolytica TaxID=2785331 RepID=A0A974RW73_9GAMM|nr:hypothetical protein [Entomomonas asaccharolytica]QQP84817.1 hypothetical protein JHT90_10435 [Entomomonas asaccharolytica]